MDRELLSEYIANGLSTYAIAQKESVGPTTVRYWLRKYGLNTKHSSFNARHSDSNGRNCEICDTSLCGGQVKFCSTVCKSKSPKKKQSDYEAQKKRAIRRKLELLKLSGGSCQQCGYAKNLSNLVFHHRDPENKTFCLDSRKLSNTKWSSILEEHAKCDLLCHICHNEHHHPYAEIDELLGPDGIDFDTDYLKYEI